jgi:SAM-dependent methyltransferase
MNPQSIPPEAYERDYFLSSICEGLDEYRRGAVSFNKSKHLTLLGIESGMRVLDAGCGRGEVLLACAKAGAEVAGIDYSESAVELSRETLADYPSADIRAGSITDLPSSEETDIAAKVDHWFELCDTYHTNELSVGQLKRAMGEAGFERYEVWLDPDVLRSGQFHLLEGFDSPIVRFAQRVAALTPIRMFLGNDLFGLGHKDAGAR